MANVVSTRCDVCSGVSERAPGDYMPPWAQIAGYRDCIRWAGGASPAVGRTQELWVGYPFFAREGDGLWLLHEADAPVLVRAALLADLGAYEGERREDYAGEPQRRLSVRVDEIVPVEALVERLPARGPAPLSGLLGDDLTDARGNASAAVERQGNLLRFDADVEGDVGVYATVVSRGGRHAMVMRSDWSMCDDGWLYAGNAPLEAAELDALCARIEAVAGV
jgi:hypothetical protein